MPPIKKKKAKKKKPAKRKVTKKKTVKKKKPFEIEFTFEGTPVTKSNSYIARWNKKLRRCTVCIKTSVVKYEKALHQAAKAIMKQEKKRPTEGLVDITITYYYPNKRTKDLHNLPKSTCDAMNKAVWKDDMQVHEVKLKRKLDRANPRVHILVKEVDDPEWENG